MEEKKNAVPQVWTEEQWEHWIYSFATEVEMENLSAPFSSSTKPEEIHSAAPQSLVPQSFDV